MRSKLYTYMFAFGCLTMQLSGCGSGGTTPDTKNTLHESTACIGCHDGSDPKVAWQTPGNGKPIVADWKLSTHMTANGAGCADCHDDGFVHPASCSKCHTAGQSKNPTKNPDQDNKCAKCHGNPNPRGVTFDGYSRSVSVPGMLSPTNTRFVHFSTGKRASYVSSYTRLHCRNCHDPHGTAFGREQRKAWSESGHGKTRGLARIILDGKTRGTSRTLDQNFGNYNYCVRCHTSTGFVNFVADNLFTNVNALQDIGPNGLPDPAGLRTNAPEYSIPRAGAPNAGKFVNSAGVPIYAGTPNEGFYKDTSREATNCNVCHLDNRINSTDTSSYSGRLRPVAINAGVKIYYPYSTAGFKTVTPVQFDTLSNSNLCLTCHSGRATGKTVSEPSLVDVVIAKKNPSAPSVHDFAGGAVLEGEKTAFLFYADPSKYKVFPAHRTLNADNNGPCITCHMPKLPSTQPVGSLIHSHLFRPVNWLEDDLNQDIIEIISNPTVCSGCHNNSPLPSQPSLSPDSMNQLRKGFRVSLLILGRLLPQPFNNPKAGDGGWTGNNIYTNVSYGTVRVPGLGNLPAASYTMGASFNYGFLFNEPSSYNHSPILARQLIYDSIDWLIHGAKPDGTTLFGTSPGDVYSAIMNVPFTTNKAVPSGQQVAKPPATIPNLFWTKVDVNPSENSGVSSNRNYATFISPTPTTPPVSPDPDRDAALFWLCNGYVPGSNECKRW